MVRILLAIVLFTIATVASSHEDRLLTLQADGSIPEILVRFGTVSLVVRFGPSGSDVWFKVGEHSTAVPACVTRLIRSRNLKDLQLTGSWYHEETLLPYYVNATFFAPGSSKDQTSGNYLSILFNLRTSDIIGVTEVGPRFLGFGHGYRRLALQDFCEPGGRT